MTDTADGQSFQRLAPIIYGALVGSSLVLIGAAALLRGGVPMALVPEARVGVSYATYALTAVLVGSSWAVRRRIPAAGALAPSGWWEAHRGRMVVLWALSEAAVGLGTVGWLLTDAILVLLVPAGAGLLQLAAYRPSKLMGLW